MSSAETRVLRAAAVSAVLIVAAAVPRPAQAGANASAARKRVAYLIKGVGAGPLQSNRSSIDAGSSRTSLLGYAYERVGSSGNWWALRDRVRNGPNDAIGADTRSPVPGSTDRYFSVNEVTRQVTRDRTHVTYRRGAFLEEGAAPDGSPTLDRVTHGIAADGSAAVVRLRQRRDAKGRFGVAQQVGVPAPIRLDLADQRPGSIWDPTVKRGSTKRWSNARRGLAVPAN